MKEITFLLIQGVLVLALAPLSIGLVKWFKAKLQTRIGPSPWLPYWSLFTLMKKEMTITKHSSWVFRSVPFVVLSAALLLAILLPSLPTHSVHTTSSNVFLVASFLMIGSMFLVFGGMDVASTFGGMGSSREMTLAALVEPAAYVVFATFGAATNAWNWSDIMAIFTAHPWYTVSPFLFLTLIALVLIILAENARYPVDNPATHLELTMVHEAMILEYSGPYLAMIEYAGMVRLTTLSLLLMNMVLPPYLFADSDAIAGVSAIALMVVRLVVAMGILALLETAIAKMRFYRMQEYMTTAFLIGLLGFLLVMSFQIV